MKLYLTTIGLVILALMLIFGIDALEAGDEGFLPPGEPTLVVKVNSSNYKQEVVEATVPVVMEFSATWCTPCKRMRPNVERAAAHYKDKVKFVTIDVDESPAIVQEWQAKGWPTMVFIRPGDAASATATRRIIGYQSTREFEDFVDSALSK